MGLCAVWCRGDITKVANDVSSGEILPETPDVELCLASCNGIGREGIAGDEDAEDRGTSP